MVLRKLKTMAPIIALSAFVSFLCLLAYENHLLQTNIASLREMLQELENQHEDLLKRYEALRGSYAVLQSNYASLTESFERLKSDYTALNETYNTLLQNYTLLQQQFQGYLKLQNKYEALLSEHQVLKASYEELKKTYEELHFAVYRPLWLNETVKPTISELKRWLAEDDTDAIPYSRWDFVCGDYALMLSVKAKMKCWDMGIVVVLGRDSQGNEFNHAFNAIRCIEGLVYVEPQNDQVFYGPISEDSWYYHPGFGRVYVETIIVIVPYQD